MLPEKNISFMIMKYVRPIWYFHLVPFGNQSAEWIEYDKLSEHEKKYVNYDEFCGGL